MTYNEFIDFNRTKEQGPYTQKHHIIPLSSGGPDIPENIIKLSWLTHYYAHYLLAKENPDNKKIQTDWKRKGDIDRWLHWCYDRYNQKGENNPNYGNPKNLHYIRSDEYKEKLSKALTGKPKSKDHIEKNRLSHLGKKHTEEHKRKISESVSGEKNPMYGKSAVKGRQWFNNGHISVLAYTCPEGFIKGRASRTKYREEE